jgi:hypothetical protein
MTALAHVGLPDEIDFIDGFAMFGTDWGYILGPAALFALIGLLIRRRGGSAQFLGLPDWCAAPLLVASAALVYAVIGFFWDVAWHIDIGRDEFLFSPPHVALLLGLSGIGLAGVLAVRNATRSGEAVGWEVGRWRVPFGSAALIAAGVAAMAGFGIDELWHWAYGLDVSMWSPPHLAMISSAAFSPLAMWLLYAEAGPNAGHRWVRWYVPGTLAGFVLVALSAWQLEFDLGVPQWQQLYQPVLIGIAAGFSLAAARTALGRGGALLAVARYLIIRLALLAMTAGVWGLTEPRFPLYIAAAVAVEAVFALAGRRSRLTVGLLAGVAVGTVGLAGEWVWSHVWTWFGWGPTLLPGIGVAAGAAVAAAVLGAGFGAVVSHRPASLRPGVVVLGLAVVVVSLVLPGPRHAPEATAEVRTIAVSDGWVHVEVDLHGDDIAADADRWEVMSWQGDGSQLARLEPVAPGSYVTDRPVPVHGSWKSIVRLACKDHLGAIAVYMPADPEIGASDVPVVPVRTEAFVPDAELLLREAHEGPRWPGVVAYTWVFVAIATILGLTLAAAVALERRRRSRGWTRGSGTLDGRRVLLTGVEGGIGRAARSALEAQGANVVGLDLRADQPGTIAVDVTNPDALDAAVRKAVERLGGLDVLRVEAGDRLSVVEVQPGYIRTSIHDAPAASGATLDGVARCEPVEHAAAAIVAACEQPRRRVTTSLRTALELTAARHAPGLADRVVRARWVRRARTVPAPRFRSADVGSLPSPDPGANGRRTSRTARPHRPGSPPARAPAPQPADRD